MTYSTAHAMLKFQLTTCERVDTEQERASSTPSVLATHSVEKLTHTPAQRTYIIRLRTKHCIEPRMQALRAQSQNTCALNKLL
ncbi:hypothetical protein BaRGS_00024770 [Batillaria attramentaria]|uniref:Uncharacterized protein n=1 Tax=Batillaria attramentaria TaxID=370345 RepID=A0ABD0KAC6_9CAEN